MKKVRIKPIAIFFTVCIVAVICLAIYIWVNVPIYPDVFPEVETEEELIEAVREDVPDLVYPDFMIDELESEGISYRIYVTDRTRFSSVEGYRIEGNVEINGKICSFSFGADVGEYVSDQCSFEYRTAKGHFNKIEQALSFGYLAFGVDGQRYGMQCQPSRTNGIVTEEDRKAIDEYLLNLAHQIIDMKIEGDTIGKE